MRLLFAGTPTLALSTLQELVSSSHEVVGVLTAADQKVGRGQRLTSSPVKEWSLGEGLTVLSPTTLKDPSVLGAVAALKADLMVVFAYGKIFRQEFLDLFPLGAINVHPSLLPRHRGPSPLIATILALDSQAGITVQKMALKMDTGNILIQEAKALIGSETLSDLMDWTSGRAPILVCQALAALAKGERGRLQKDNEATYCPMIFKEMGFLAVESTPEAFVAQVRALNPSPATRLLVCLDSEKREEEVLIRRARVINSTGSIGSIGEVLGLDAQNGLLLRVGTGVVGLLGLQRQGKKSVRAQDFWNGIRDKEKIRFKSMTKGEAVDAQMDK